MVMIGNVLTHAIQGARVKLQPCVLADRAFMDMVGTVDKELTTFSFKLARLLFPVTAIFTMFSTLSIFTGLSESLHPHRLPALQSLRLLRHGCRSIVLAMPGAWSVAD